jgi:hypothetical protein
MAAWSPAATPSRVWPSPIFALSAAMLMSASRARHQPRAHRRAVHGADDGLVAVDDVVDQVARLLPDARAHREVAGHVLHQRQVAAAGKAHAFAAQHHGAHAVVLVDVAPDFGQLPVAVVAGGGQLAVLGLHLHVEHAAILPAAADVQALIAAVVDGGLAHGGVSVWVQGNGPHGSGTPPRAAQAGRARNTSSNPSTTRASPPSASGAMRWPSSHQSSSAVPPGTR